LQAIHGALRTRFTGGRRKELARELGVTDQTLYNWRSKYSGINVSDAKRLNWMAEDDSDAAQAAAPGTFKVGWIFTFAARLLRPLALDQVSRSCLMRAMQKNVGTPETPRLRPSLSH